LNGAGAVDGGIELRDLGKSYREGARERVVFAGIDASFGSGEFVAIQGRSGAGKSTLLNIIAGIDVPTAGSVHIGGHNITALDEQRRTLLRRQYIGFIFQFFNLIPTLNVEENLCLPLELNGHSALSARERARDLLETLQLAGIGARYPEEISGGEQQRVAVARAVAHRPAVVLADEPTGNLDSETERLVLDVLADLPARFQCCLIVATHSDEVAARADRVFRLQNGGLEPA